MSRLISTVNAARWTLAALAIAALSGCGEATGPADPVAQTIHTVRIRFDSVTVMGSCDHNSIFESQQDGEFDFKVTVADAGGYTTEFRKEVSSTMLESTYRFMTSWEAVVRRDVSGGVGLRVQFWASERDGLLGNDPAMSDRNLWNTHQWNGTSWTGGRGIELIGSSQCGVRIRYTITSAPID